MNAARMNTVAKNLMPADADLRSVMARLNEGVLGVVFLVDDDSVIQGVITDGNVRRALLAGAALDSPARAVMTSDFVRGDAAADRSENLKLLNSRIRHLPIVDKAGCVVDILSWAEIWKVPVSAPHLGGNELKYVSDAINSGWVSSQGDYIGRFETMFAQYHGTPWALAVSNGTSALHLGLMAVRVQPGDEVIVPDLTFGASANAVLHAGGRPIFVDVDPATWTMDIESVRRAITPRTKAIMPVHLYGHPCDMDPLMDIARQHGLKVIEDCAESLGAEYKGTRTGVIGDVGCFSFFANKVITTGEGGMVTGRDPEMKARIELLRDHGMTKTRRYWHVEPGYNYRLTNVQAAIGLAQMEQIDRFLDRRRACVARYQEGLAGLDLALPVEAPWAKSIFWLYSLCVPVGAGISRDALAAKLSAQGVDTRPVFPPLHNQPAFRMSAGTDDQFPVSSRIGATGISLPMANDLTAEKVDEICRLVRETVRYSKLIFAHP